MKMREMIRNLLMTLLIFFLISLISARDGGSIALVKRRIYPKQEGVCILKDKPTVYIDYERNGQRKPLGTGESDHGVWLRIHNNTKWGIILEMNSVPSKEYGDSYLFYEVLTNEKVIIDARCHVCSINTLPPGKSILFSVPLNHLQPWEYAGKTIGLRIRFNYEWEAHEGKSTALEPRHYVYFYSSILPQSLTDQSK